MVSAVRRVAGNRHNLPFKDGGEGGQEAEKGNKEDNALGGLSRGIARPSQRTVDDQEALDREGCGQDDTGVTGEVRDEEGIGLEVDVVGVVASMVEGQTQHSAQVD